MTSFSEALQAIKSGQKARRALWPSNTYIFLVPGSEFTVNRYPLSTIYPEGTVVKYAPHIDISREGVEGVKKVSTWFPRNEELLAEDWELSGLF